MGNMWYTNISHPDTAPDVRNPPTFDPLYGFPNGRKERTIKATREEIDRANVSLDKRDYCVDNWLEFLNCRQQHYPRVKRYCSHYLHHWEECERDDAILRIKEWEREKRLKERAKRKACREELEAMAE